MLDFGRFDVLSFDCYGTLIDWESGILDAVRPVLVRHDVDVGDDKILETYALIEAEKEEGNYSRYDVVLREVMAEMGVRLGFTPAAAELDCLSVSIKDWKPFPDTVEALGRLKRKYKLCILSNVDEKLFAGTAPWLEVPFDYVVTAQQAQAYKPSYKMFQLAFDTVGLPPEKFLHVAQSIYHDIVPAKALGVSNVWVHRQTGHGGGGATKPTVATPDVEVKTLGELADLMGL
jgi:2-haloacid dehalogenase